jgi:tetratricopeptide (TPR) repeat protein
MANSGISFEKMIAELLSTLGWETQFTSTSSDQGIDIICECREEILVVQCKDWSSRVGNAAVQEIYSGKGYKKAHLAVVIASNGYTKQAHDLATALGVMLLTPSELCTGCILDRTIEGKIHTERKKWIQNQREIEFKTRELINIWDLYETQKSDFSKQEANRGPYNLKIISAIILGIAIPLYIESIIAFIFALWCVYRIWVPFDKVKEPTLPPKERPQKYVCPTEPDWQMLLGIELKKEKKYDKAIHIFTKIIQLNPKCELAYDHRGDCWHKKSEYKKAVDDYSMACTLNSNNFSYYHNQAVGHHNMGDYNLAIKNYDKAISLNSQESLCYFSRGRVYEDKNDFKKALSDYESAVRLDPSCSEALDSIQRVQIALQKILKR